ncbi:immunoglobulin-like domain-containing receptor 2 isoform X3 [Danio rerio]|uniref:immunoglobulin-like domain-containing receptor 2 isoform X3 n=1 Tax=Danio rerio TaxID=7955 RepID=UPI0003836539|nr:immunoglobulin-like domain-containing receptor 2 isoform X3 [Danio rerio]|eukprot:XP_005167904.1 immunoglobulin-like domain-containing receptor 2 isoform X3 [Danio rerio]
MFLLHAFWILFTLFSLQSCDGVQVVVKDEKKFAMLFSSIVLPCHYTTHSTQTAVVQWWYKSYCTDRTRDSFTFPESLGVHVSDLGASSHRDCSDNSRTVRIVASGQGASMTLAEHYKGRDISIINKADLHIGQLQWGDSGVYFCKVIISDDLEGKNEGQVELLVQEWAFVGVVVVGSILFLLLVGICWCQCCPHSCCCYVRCCCCPDTCCCPKHLYEAGKMAKSGQPPQITMYQPYYVPGVPVVPVVPPAASSIIEPKLPTVPPSVENNIAGMRSGYRLQASQGQDAMKVVYYLERDLAQFHPTKGASHPSADNLSELSSLHDGDVDFRQTYRQVQRKALPPIIDHLDEPRLRTASIGHGLRPSHYQSDHSLDEHDNRWNCRSEHLPRKAFDSRGRTVSLDELEEFAMSYGPHGRRRGDIRGPQRDFEMAPRTRDHPTSYRNGPRYLREDDDSDWHRRGSPPSPPKRRDTADSERYVSRQRSYDDTYLNSLLERKARGHGERGGRVDDDSDTPSKGSSKKSSDCYQSRSPSNRPEEEDPLPPYSEREGERFRTEEPTGRERYRTADPAMRPFSYTRPPHGLSQTLQERREDRDKPRKLTTHLSRDSLIV